MKTIILTSCALGVTALSGATHAGVYQGMTIDALGDVGYGQTYRMYVHLEEGARLDAVFGNNSNALSIGAADGMSFYQNALGGPTSMSINSAFFPLAPSLEWDSYVSIGALTSSNNALVESGMDWGSFNSGGSLSADNGAWFVTPDQAQGALLNGKVFIGQFTVMGGTGNGVADLIGQVNLQGIDSDGNTFQEFGATWVPAPGALALLGLAGVATRRRRN